MPVEAEIAHRMPRGVVKRDNKGGHYVDCVGPEAATKKGAKRHRQTLHIWRNVEPNGTVKLGYRSFAEPRPSFHEIDAYVRHHLGCPTYMPPPRPPKRGRSPEAIKRSQRKQDAHSARRPSSKCSRGRS